MSWDERESRETSEARVAAELGEILTAPIVPGGARWPIVMGELPGDAWYDPCAACGNPRGRRVGVGAEPLCDRCTDWHYRILTMWHAARLMRMAGKSAVFINITA